MIVPVFDVKDGVFVSGKSGERDTYCKLNSVYGNSPQDIVLNLRRSGAKCVYIADLDKIEGVGDNSDLISRINGMIPVLLDNGANCIDDVVFNRNICSYSILATETMKSIDETARIFKEHPFEKLIISIDIKNNELLTDNDDIKLDDVISLVNNVKVPYIIILNISQVGTLGGNNGSLIKEIIDETPSTQHIIAGGVTNESIAEYKRIGIDNFLIGTVLHDGSLSKKYEW